MAKLDLYPHEDGYIVDVQSDLLDHMATRIVVPLIPEESAPAAIASLNPCFEIGTGRYVLLTQSLAAVPKAMLGSSVGSLAAQEQAISRALDLLFYGV